MSKVEYGVVVYGTNLEKAGFKTLKAAKKYLSALYSRGLLYGRSVEILAIDNDSMSSKVVFEKSYNSGSLPNGKWTKVKAVRIVHKGGHKVIQFKT